MGERPSGLYLYREFVTVHDESGPISGAVRAMMSATPGDPDFMTPWRPPTSLDISQDGDAITVDVSADAFANTDVGSELAELGVQQLVWTATAAAQTPGPVTILVDGEPADAWGTVALGGPMSRDPEARAMLWLETPVEGAEVAAGDVEFAGQADVFEGHVAWEVADSSGEVVAQGAASASMGQFVRYAFTVSLQPGTYTAYAFSPDESGGESPEGPRGWEQSRSFVVR